ncbi:hypothetical protein EMCG_06746 [[Emmonsia] crescens]|uniref:Protein kinase domain-containing protein n=1 Tax=[Emmonsia] crescens TaxID=73230 RepID=A0A0G2IA82_9EURO|nr:hypothetical protein EMCG_06746 [Emmonsia crescens UAMH 3008]
MELTQAQESLPPNTYIKRPNLSLYNIFQEYNVLSLIPKGLLEEAQAMEKISKHSHPNFIYYHSCRIRRGRITSLVLDHHPNTPTDYLKNKVGSIDKEPFMQALKSAIYHLHSLGWAHNDLHPGNILVDEDGMLNTHTPTLSTITAAEFAVAVSPASSLTTTPTRRPTI